MSTKIRPELSQKNEYWIPKHRYYELKHFCLQYPDWKHSYDILGSIGRSHEEIRSYEPGDPTSKIGIKKATLSSWMDMVDCAADALEPGIRDYILLGVTKSIPYDNLKTKYRIPYCKETYYKEYRKFFWNLHTVRR